MNNVNDFDAEVQLPDVIDKESLLYRRAMRIFEWIRDEQRTGKWYSINEVAAFTGIPNNGRAFTDALCLARKIAPEYGEIISYCKFDSGRGYHTFRHIREGNEGGEAFATMATRTRAIIAQGVNLARQSEVLTRLADDPLHREVYRSNARVMGFFAMAADEQQRLLATVVQQQSTREAPSQMAA